ncbi:hypothetical protein PSTT_16597 [Puccinia striiformis]|uniref:Uncharacterized protein n=1 Tax=Puccinia striiformis TaxID=27350 RepID=A0A2S4UCD3_9BASI|nr:hypothetical protein PSTT_16597 [Puccinia striiformis]
MLYTKILVSLQLLQYYSISAHPLSSSQNLVKRAGSDRIAELTHLTSVQGEEAEIKLDSPTKYGALHMEEAINQEERNVNLVGLNAGRAAGVEEQRAFEVASHGESSVKKNKTPYDTYLAVKLKISKEKLTRNPYFWASLVNEENLESMKQSSQFTRLEDLLLKLNENQKIRAASSGGINTQESIDDIQLLKEKCEAVLSNLTKFQIKLLENYLDWHKEDESYMNKIMDSAESNTYPGKILDFLESLNENQVDVFWTIIQMNQEVPRHEFLVKGLAKSFMASLQQSQVNDDFYEFIEFGDLIKKIKPFGHSTSGFEITPLEYEYNEILHQSVKEFTRKSSS